jgi:hypothetical protein
LRQSARLASFCNNFSQAKQRFQRLRSLQEHSQSFTPEELAVARGQFFKAVISSCAALSSALPVLGEAIQSVLLIVDQRPDFHTEEFLSQFTNDKPETVMNLPPREFLRRWAGWLARKAGWRGDPLHLRVPEDLKFGDFYSWLHAAIKVLSSNDVFTPYLPKGESLKSGSSLVFAGEKIMRDWAMKKSVFLAARLAAGDIDAAQAKERERDESDLSSYSSSSGEWSSSAESSEGSNGDEDEHSEDGSQDDDWESQSQVSRASKKSANSRASEQISFGDDTDSGSEEASSADDDYSEDDDEYSRAGSNRSGGSSKSKIALSIGTRIKQQNQVRHVLGDDSALAADIAEMEEESRLSMIRERREAAKKKKAEEKAGKKGGKKKTKKVKPSKVSFKEEDGASSAKKELPKAKKKKKSRRRKRRLKINVSETAEQRELRQLLMVRDAIIKSSRPLREGSDRIYRTFKMAATAVITGVRMYRATVGFFFKFKPPPELEAEGMTAKERMAKVVELFRQYLPAGFLVDFGALKCFLHCLWNDDSEEMSAIPNKLTLRWHRSGLRCAGATLRPPWFPVCLPSVSAKADVSNCAGLVSQASRRCMHSIKPEKKAAGKFRARNEQISNASSKDRLLFSQVTLTGLQLVLQELVAAQPPHLIPDLSDEEIDFQVKSWLHRCSSAWTQMSTIACDLTTITQKEQKRLALWEHLQTKVQKMRAEFNMQRTHVALLEVKRRQNLEKEESAQQKKKELAEAIAFQKEAAKSKEGRRALAKLSHVTVSLIYI